MRKLAWLISAFSTRKSSDTPSSFLVIPRGGSHFQGISLPSWVIMEPFRPGSHRTGHLQIHLCWDGRSLPLCQHGLHSSEPAGSVLPKGSGRRARTMMGRQGGLPQDTPSLLWPCSTCPSVLWGNTARLITFQFPDPQSTGFGKLKVYW